MDDTIHVRDHSLPCEHGSLWPHWIGSPREAKWWHGPDCPGGREMILRRVDGGLWEEVGAPEDG